MKRAFKLCHLFIFVVLFSFIVQKTAYAANDTINSASIYQLGTTQNGDITSDQEYYYYRFTLPQSGRINIQTTAHMEWVYVRLYNEFGEELWGSNPKWNSTSEVIVENDSFDLTKGTYYYCLKRDGNRYGQFSFNINFTSAGESFEETGTGTNNKMTSAASVSVSNVLYKGQLAMNDDQDYYKFSLNSSGLLTLNFSGGMEWVYVYIYDDMGNELWKMNPRWNSTSERIVEEAKLEFTKGTYYLRVCRDGSRSGNYEFSMGFVSAGESFTETNGGSNNTLATASAIKFNQKYTGQIAINDNKDFYKVQVLSTQNISLQINAKMETLYVTVYDGRGNEIWKNRLSWNSTSGEIAYTNNELTVNAGTYYIVFSRDWQNGNYSFEVGAYYEVTGISLNAKKKTVDVGKSFTLKATIVPSNATNKNLKWSSSNENVAKVVGGKVKTYKAGKADIKVVSIANDKVSATCRVVVKPKKVKLKKVKKYYSYWSGKGFQATYSISKGSDGFQIAYCKNKNFKKGVKKAYSGSTTFTVSGLKKGTYYVRVRGYVWNDNNRVYGAWSNVKSIKVK